MEAFDVSLWCNFWQSNVFLFVVFTYNTSSRKAWQKHQVGIVQLLVIKIYGPEHVSWDFSDFLLLDSWGGWLSLKWIIFTWWKLPIYGTYFLSSFGFQAVVWWTLRYLAVMYEQFKVGRGWYNKNMKLFPTLCIAAIVTVGDKNGCPGGFFCC